MSVLVTGGAGYIGSIVTEELIKRGEDVVVFDNLACGHRSAVHPEARFVQGNLANLAAVEALANRKGVDLDSLRRELSNADMPVDARAGPERPGTNSPPFRHDPLQVTPPADGPLLLGQSLIDLVQR